MAYRIEGDRDDWEVVIGLEVHAQVVSQSKLFSGASTLFGGEPNSQVSPVDAGMPGMLPVLNRFCVEQAVRTGLGLKAKINLTSVFARKNYFYPDLPNGYQISQYEQPVVGEGAVIVDMPDGSAREIGIERLHLEQDAGKSLHDQHPAKSFIDLNRAGVALMEIVSRPDMRSPEEAGLYVTKIRSLLRYLGTCDGNMQEGSLRCDANVSVRKVGETALRTRCEIKNINSIRFLQQAIDYEARRQVDLYESGGAPVQETRLYDSVRGETRSMRSKEHAHDYRYFPDPDLPPLVLTQEYVDGIKASLPELPDEKKHRFIAEYGLSPYDAGVLAAERASAEFYEAVAKGRDAKLAANWVTGEIFALMRRTSRTFDDPPVSAAGLGELLDLIKDGTLTRALAREVLAIMAETGRSPGEIAKERGLESFEDLGAMHDAIDAVLAASQDKVAEYRSGKDKLFGFFVGQVMRATGGKANPALVNAALKKRLG